MDCIEAGDEAHLREELGDVLMQVVLHAQIAADAGAFHNGRRRARHQRQAHPSPPACVWRVQRRFRRRGARHLGQRQSLPRRAPRTPMRRRPASVQGPARGRSAVVAGAHGGSEGLAQGGFCGL
ncbi:MAG: MazG nucleotide pyrophosphohydrolase domain-containing protein [Collinsella intestinalis]